MAGWILSISVHPVGEDQGKMIITVNVRHSQSVTVPPLKSWVAAEKCVAIIYFHCTCMTGLGGACSHIVALLFAAEVYNRPPKLPITDISQWVERFSLMAAVLTHAS